MGKDSISRNTFAKGVAAGVVVAASLGILAIGEYTIGGGGSPTDAGPASAVPEASSSAAAVETTAPAAASSSAEAPASGSYTPGTYTATARGLDSDITVTATFNESKITEITADVSGETPGIGAEIGDPIIQKALEAQSSEIDGIAGATISSDAFKAALADCISQAGGGSPSDEAATAQTETVSETATTEAAPEAGTTETEATPEAGTAETEAAPEPDTTETEATAAQTEPAISYMEPTSYETVSVSPEGPFLAGTYTASAEGASGDVLVTMTFDESSILSVDADVSAEAAGRGRLIDSEMEERILAAQTADVDGVSGATITSDAIRSAAADCIAQASASAIIGGADGPTSIFLKSSADEIAYREPETYEAVSESPEAPFTVGTYTASAAGISSDIVVTMTFDESGILSMDVDVSGEPHGKGSLIDTEITKRVLAAQTADVDGISGATVTSDAILSATADCIAQAKAAGNASEPESEAETASEAESELLTPAELAAAELEDEPESELLTPAELAAAQD